MPKTIQGDVASGRDPTRVYFDPKTALAHYQARANVKLYPVVRGGRRHDVLAKFRDKPVSQGFVCMIGKPGRLVDPQLAYFMTDRLAEHAKTDGFLVNELEGTFNVSGLEGLIVGGTPHIHTLVSAGGEDYGGHVRLAMGERMVYQVAALLGAEIHREFDEETNVGHLRFKKSLGEKGSHLVFTISSGRQLLPALHSAMKAEAAGDLELLVGVGTLRTAELEVDRGRVVKLPQDPEYVDGYELLSMRGDAKKPYVVLIDTDRNVFFGELKGGTVKDLVEGVGQVING